MACGELNSGNNYTFSQLHEAVCNSCLLLAGLLDILQEKVEAKLLQFLALLRSALDVTEKRGPHPAILCLLRNSSTPNWVLELQS